MKKRNIITVELSKKYAQVMNNYNILSKNKSITNPGCICSITKEVTKMKKLLAITGAILISSIIITSFINPTTPGAVKDGESAQQNSQQSDSYAQGYIVSEFAGRIALYRIRDNKVLFSTDTLVSDLPKADREALRSGIPAADMKEADRIIAELSS